MSRPDGRAFKDHRPVTIQRHVLSHAHGSALVSVGRTQVVCSAWVSSSVPEFRRASHSGWLTAEYAMLPCAASQRVPRASSLSSRRGAEISRFVGRCLRAVVDLDALGPWLIQVDCDVVNADAGTRCASLLGGLVAVHDALKTHSLQAALREPVVAVSVAWVDGVFLVDPCYEEDHRASVDLTLAVTQSGQLVEVHAATEGRPYAPSILWEMVGLGLEAAAVPLGALASCGIGHAP